MGGNKRDLLSVFFLTFSIPSDTDNTFNFPLSVCSEATQDGSGVHATASSQASLQLVRTLVHHERGNLCLVAESYRRM